jgi:hypothetical protein
MKKYLLSVYQSQGDPPPPEILERIGRDVDAFHRELKAAGAWVFAGGLHAPSTATVVQFRDGELITTDGPFAESKEHVGGCLHHHGARSRLRARVGREGGAGDHAADRGPAVPRRGRGRMTEVPGVTTAQIERVFNAEYGRAVAVLVRVFGDIDVAEEAVQDAFTAAVQRWPSAGLPPSPAGWIITTARNRAIDRLRREASRHDRHAQAALLHAGDEPVAEGAVPTIGCA